MYHHPEAARRGPKPPGQLRSRVEELKNPWRPCSPLTLSHNESARMATDALLEHGEDGYLRVLADEKELPFLSSLDIEYVRNNVDANNKDALQHAALVELSEEDCLSEQTSGTYFPLMSDIEVPALELGWPEVPPSTKRSQTEVKVLFQRDRSNTIKDLLRSLISQAQHVIAIVMDLFTDVDILCDLVAASSKRRIPVYLLLDEKNLGYFIEMWDQLNFKSIQCPNLKVRTVAGSTYCTKSGKKFSGQFLEKFLLIDCEQVVTGTYSFSWLSNQVHSNMVTLFKGKIVEDFDTEFRCLYAESTIVDYFYNADDRSNSYSRPVVWNTQPVLRSAQVHAPVLSNNSSTLSNSSVSSLKASPYMSSPIHKDKELPPDFINQGRREVIGDLRINLNNQNRRPSDPNTAAFPYADHSLRFHSKSNLLNVRTSLLSRSTPALNLSEPVPNLAQLNIAETNGSTRMKSDYSFNQDAHGNQTEGENDANADRARHKDISIEQGSKLIRSDNRQTLGHRHLQMMLDYRPGIVTATKGLQAEYNAPARRKSDVSLNQAETATHTEHKKGACADPVAVKGISNEHSINLNRDENTMTLGHSRLDMITNFRPRAVNNLQPENTTSTSVKSDRSLNQSANANHTESKKDACHNPVGVKDSLKEQSSTFNSDEKTMTLGHSKLDMMIKCRPQPTIGTRGLQPEYKTSAMVKSDISCNDATGSHTESEKNACTTPMGIKESSSDSSNLKRNDKRLTMGHSKLDMMTSHNKGKPNQVYSRFNL